MSLVAYEASDDESIHEDDYEDKNTSKVTVNQSNSVNSFNEELVEDNHKISGLFTKLPAPKTVSSTSLPNSSLSDIVVNKKTSGGPIKITAPSLKYYTEDSDSDEERKAKRFKGSAKGTGLTSLLPKPKGVNQKVTNTSLIPQSLTRSKRNTTPSAPKPTQTAITEKMNYFFDDNEKSYDLTHHQLSDKDYGPQPQPQPQPQSIINETNDYSTSQSSSLSTSTTSGQSVNNDMAYKRMIASKFGNEDAAENIKIVDINVSQHLSHSKDWLKTITEEKEEEYTGVQPTSTAKRKHQITYLALQAKQREVELKNQWALNKATKSQSRAKYGF
ncbi:proline-rich protein PRCC-like [Oppia nitens]|uniref:proline-rich protein PRCC-like n=1 Tax=Oppia nitens TaxID=1686743 RepID=UPI0023DBBAE9|nr:proline-rich protein PRCC-like [Oppia nitens]